MDQGRKRTRAQQYRLFLPDLYVLVYTIVIAVTVLRISLLVKQQRSTTKTCDRAQVGGFQPLSHHGQLKEELH